MTAVRRPPNPSLASQKPLPVSPADRPDATCTAADVFAELWKTLAEMLGPSATAALLQRSIKRAAADDPNLVDLVITRQQFAYTYSLPLSWEQPAPAPLAALERINRQLWPLLSDLTGSVVVRRLQENPMLRACGVIPLDFAS